MAQRSPKTEADIAWGALFDTSETEQQQPGSFTWFKSIYTRINRDWNLGLNFWKQFPEDRRRIFWFTSCTEDPLFYKDLDGGLKAKLDGEYGYYNAEIDWEKLNAYDKERVKIRSLILNDPDIPGEKKNMLRTQEIGLIYERGHNKAFRNDKGLYLAKVQDAFETAIIGLKKNEKITRLNDGFRFIPEIFTNSTIYGYNADEYLVFLNRYKDTPNLQVRGWITKQLAVLKLRKVPFELKHKDVEGKEVDLTELRGKVVLVDFWTTSCSTCIARMPVIKQIYDRYKNQGFVVISAAYHPEEDREKVLVIHEKIGADWPVMLLGGDAKSGYINPNSLGKKIFNAYGFIGVPQLLLLGKDGKLIMYNDLLLTGDFEPLVKKLLSE